MTIDVGIDLGTTNSVIAVLIKNEPVILRNNDGSDITPSVIGCSKGRLFVGDRAKGLAEKSPLNVQMEFKRAMGSDYRYTFKECGVTMTPEEMSAEVLKVLSASYYSRFGRNVKATVITVPAAFELPQCEATKQAATLAGFEQVVILQEPIAAAIAYGYQRKTENVYWLVYDLGGGTFDVALINPKEGLFRVVNHRGDNQLGGKDLDQAILREVVLPQIRNETGLNDFTIENKEKWNIPLVKLKNAIETAKIRLSQSHNETIEVNDLFEGVLSLEYDFITEINEDTVIRLAKPLIQRTIRLCEELLTESKLTKDKIEKLILVGGPTLAPYVRSMLQDPNEGLDIPLEYSIDPMTVVAQGAAIFAGNQKLEIHDAIEVHDEDYLLELTQYERIGTDPEPFIGGRVVSLKNTNLSGLRLELKNQRWSSGLINVAANGSFSSILRAEPDIENLYEVNLFDTTGKPLSITPKQISYIIGNALAKQILIHSIGIALTNNEVAVFLRKGEPLPARRKNTLYTSKDIKKSDPDSILRVPIIEGENSKADRNNRIGYIDIHTAEISRDIPVGSEIEVTIELDESRLLRTMAYIPLLDLEIDKIHEFEKKKAEEQSVLDGWLFLEKERFEEIRESIVKIGDPSLLNLIKEIESIYNLDSLRKEISDSKSDTDAAIKAERHILEFRIALDKLEEQLEWPLLEVRAREEEQEIEYLLSRINDPQAQNKHLTLLAEFQHALQAKDKVTAKAKIDEMIQLRVELFLQLPEAHYVIFKNLMTQNDKFRDQWQAQQLFAEGHRAINNNDINQLVSVNQQLFNLLSEQDKNILRAYGSSVIR